MAKKVLIAGATGLVGYAAMKHFGTQPDCEVVALSRRRPDTLFGARWHPLDLGDAAACAALAPEFSGVTHLVYAALHERPGLVAGWREDAQIRTNTAMLANLFGAVEQGSTALRHVALLQGHQGLWRPRAAAGGAGAGKPLGDARAAQFLLGPGALPPRPPARHSVEMGRSCKLVLIVGCSVGSAMNVIPALGVYAALMKRAGKKTLDYPCGAGRVAQAVDADLLARAIAWSGEAAAARNEIFNVTNGDVFVWPNVWPAIAEALGFEAGAHVLLSLDREIRPREAEWAEIRREHGLVSGDLREFVGLSFEYADYTMGFGRTEGGPPALVSTVKLMQAGFTETIDTEVMFRKAFAEMQARRLLPEP